MGRYVLGLDETDRTHIELVGGKGAHLGELTRLEDVSVPAGFCVTTEAFAQAMGGARTVETRRDIEDSPLPDDVAAAITAALAVLGEEEAVAVRSSATAEDLPTASFAGQHDTFLNVVGPVAVLDHVRRCWASLFTERAVAYRQRNGVDNRGLRMAVVVQRMVDPQSAGVLFTADPVTGNRRVASVEAVRGLADALVSGKVGGEVFKVRAGVIVERAGEPQRHDEPALTDHEVLRLTDLGRRIEAHFGHPQDIEWCLADGVFHIVQSRPITTLFPIPQSDDAGPRVYVSVGHQQMMTDPMKPLGLSVWKLTSPAPMRDAGGRLFVDVTDHLASPVGRSGLVAAMGRSDPLIADALQTVIDRGFVPDRADQAPPAPPPGVTPAAPIEPDPAIVSELVAQAEESLRTVRREIATRSGPDLLAFILQDFQELRRVLSLPRSREVIIAGMQATWWLNDTLAEWLGETNAADTLAQSVPHNVTSEMGLALLDVADAIRPHPEVAAFLRQVDLEDEGFLGRLPALPGGQEARDAIEAYLDVYGMRCVGEIDITRPRWRERPAALVPMILSHLEHYEPGEGQRRFEQGLREAQRAQETLLRRLRDLPGGEAKAAEAKQMIDRVRTFSGYREYPKYGMISRYFVYKQALLREAERLVQAGVLRDPEDIFFLTLAELHDVVLTQQADQQLIRQRQEAFRTYAPLTPPRVLTSDGEGLAGRYRRDDVPPDALVGLAVSAGTVEGRARVVAEMGQVELAPGDILVTAFTDPSWTPAFVAVSGLVTEVGGLMTHGAVIAREYGLPAVVGVEHATALISDGQRIRVDGTSGFVELRS